MTLPRPWLLRALEIETRRDADTTGIAREAVHAFLAALDAPETAEADLDTARALLRAWADRLAAARPTLAPLVLWMERCAAAAGHGTEAARREATAILQEAEGARERLAAAAGALFRPGLRLLTLGDDPAVRHLLARHADRLEGVTVCEGRPRMDGVELAAAVGQLAIPVRLITEAEMELFASEADAALVGVERLLPSGEIVGRTGTALLARVCAAHGLSFYAAVESARRIPEGHPLAVFRPERRPPGELLPEAPPGVEVVNIPFDCTPAALVTAYLTESGVERPPAAT